MLNNSPMKKELISRGQTDIYARIQCKKTFVRYFIKKFKNFDFNENLCIRTTWIIHEITHF